jgi:hypothetical protein
MATLFADVVETDHVRTGTLKQLRRTYAMWRAREECSDIQLS